MTEKKIITINVGNTKAIYMSFRMVSLKNHLINILMKLYEVIKLLKILTELPIIRQSTGSSWILANFKIGGINELYL